MKLPKDPSLGRFWREGKLRHVENQENDPSRKAIHYTYTGNVDSRSIRSPYILSVRPYAPRLNASGIWISLMMMNLLNETASPTLLNYAHGLAIYYITDMRNTTLSAGKRSSVREG